LLAVFAACNEAVWAAQVLAYLLGLLMVVLTIRCSARRIEGGPRMERRPSAAAPTLGQATKPTQARWLSRSPVPIVAIVAIVVRS